MRYATAACGNIGTGLLLRPPWPVHFFLAVSDHLMLIITSRYTQTAIRCEWAGACQTKASRFNSRDFKKWGENGR